MITGTSLTAAAVSIVGHPTEATSLESTSATTTYHRMTVDGVGVFYREAGPKEAPTIVLLHGFPSSSREFDTFIPLLATRYHLIAPDFPGFGQSEPRHHHRMCTPLTIWPRRSTSFSSNSRSTNTPSTFMTMAGRSAFASSRRIRSGCRRLSSRMPMRIRKAWAPSGLPLRNIGPIRKRILKCSMFSCRSQRPNSVTPSAPRIPNVITRIPGLTSTPIYQGPGNTRSRGICSTTTKRTLLRIRRGKRRCVSTGHRLWWSGGGTILRSLVPGAKRSSATCRTPRSIYSTPAISLGREKRRDRESYSCVLGQTFRLTNRCVVPGAAT
jgi:alpha/beta hydrolase family protein